MLVAMHHNGDCARRLLRLSQSCDVLPSLAAVAELAPSRADLDTFILRLSLQNLQAGTSSQHTLLIVACLSALVCLLRIAA